MTVVTIFSMPCLVSPDANFCGRAFITAATGKVNRIDARTWPSAKREFSKDWKGERGFFQGLEHFARFFSKPWKIPPLFFQALEIPPRRRRKSGGPPRQTGR
jgi:hypothetical protein